jgi:hypothetical protein
MVRPSGSSDGQKPELTGNVFTANVWLEPLKNIPTRKAARVAFKGLIDKPNPAVQLMKPLEMTIGELCQHFRHRELARDDNWRSYSTRKNYSFLLRRWIIPRWGNLGLGEVRTIESRLGSAVCREQEARAPKYETSCQFSSITRGGMSYSIAIPLNWSGKAPKGGLLQAYSPPPKSSCCWTISNLASGHWFSSQPQRVSAKVNCLRSSGVISISCKAP